MNKEQKMVLDFHRKNGFTINESPILIDERLWKIRHDHTLDELEELQVAHHQGNLVGVADALSDLIYFLYGTAVAYGIDLEPVFDEIHRSNMTKDRPSGDRKAVKGLNYSPPSVTPIIASQIRKAMSKGVEAIYDPQILSKIKGLSIVCTIDEKSPHMISLEGAKIKAVKVEGEDKLCVFCEKHSRYVELEKV